MFTRKHGRNHAIIGLIYLVCLLYGLFSVSVDNISPLSRIVYDISLGVVGTLLPLTAARDFGHKNIKNVASGTLDEHATVTYSEMIEHSFYQGLNLLQVIYFHGITANTPLNTRIIYLLLVTSPWLLRNYFPINKFSDNYVKIDDKSTPLIRLLYRIKKYQYVFYKHFLLHGLNISVALNGYQIIDTMEFRLYWLLLNTSYTMEFFLQTLVKKRYMTQNWMLHLQKVLMLASSIAAYNVLLYVNVYVAIISMIFNFINRKHDVLNTLIISVGVIFFSVDNCLG